MGTCTQTCQQQPAERPFSPVRLFSEAFPDGKPTQGITDPHLSLVPSFAALGFAEDGDLDNVSLGDPDVEVIIQDKYGPDVLEWYRAYTVALENDGALMERRWAEPRTAQSK